jgi:ABC-2 type transport system permease protein
MTSFVILLGDLALPYITLLIYGSGYNIKNWSFHEILIIQGIFLIAKGISGILFFSMISTTLYRIREGTFDLILIKPASTIFISFVEAFELNEIGTFIAGIIISYNAIENIGYVEPINYFYFGIIFIFSIIVLLAFTLIMTAVSFIWVGNGRIFEIFDNITLFGNYPRSIFSKTIQNIITYIIPISLIAYYPSSILMGRNLNGLYFSMIISIIFLLFSLSFWKLMISKYTSAGG